MVQSKKRATGSFLSACGKHPGCTDGQITLFARWIPQQHQRAPDAERVGETVRLGDRERVGLGDTVPVPEVVGVGVRGTVKLAVRVGDVVHEGVAVPVVEWLRLRDSVGGSAGAQQCVGRGSSARNIQGRQTLG